MSCWTGSGKPVRRALGLFLLRAHEYCSLGSGSWYINGQCLQVSFNKVMLISFITLSKVVSHTMMKWTNNIIQVMERLSPEYLRTQVQPFLLSFSVFRQELEKLSRLLE